MVNSSHIAAQVQGFALGFVREIGDVDDVVEFLMSAQELSTNVNTNTATLTVCPSVSALSIKYPGCWFGLWPSTSFGFHGSIEIAEPNPKGRLVCSVSVKRRQFWTDEELLAAIRVAAHWFRDIGGMGMLQAKQIGHVIARLKKGTEEQSMHWAIDAYATSEWHRGISQTAAASSGVVPKSTGGWAEV